MTDWRPTEKQTEFLLRKEFEVGFGGARGGGKTDAGMAALLYPVKNPLYRALVLRRNAEDLKDWTDRAERFYSRIGGVKVGTPPEFVFPSGAKIRTGHLKDDNAFSKYQGHEYQRMLVEELTQISREQNFEKLIISCRSTVAGVEPQVLTTFNPGGPGHEWVKARYGLNGVPKGITTDGRRCFVPSKVDDNPHLMAADPTYVERLRNLPKGLKEQWLDGSWDDFEIEGSYYAHLVKEAEEQGRIGDWGWLRDREVHTFWDLGLADSMAVWFVQEDGGTFRVIRYMECEGKSFADIAPELKSLGYAFAKHHWPHDGRQREFSTGQTRLEAAEALGIRPIRIVPNLPIIDGIEKVRTNFNRFRFDRIGCVDGLSALRSYRKRWMESLNRFSDEALHDWASHGADAFRMLAVSLDELKSDSQLDVARERAFIRNYLES